MFVTGIDKVFGDDATGHLQTGDIAVEATAHLGARESTGGTQLSRDETAMLLKCQKDGLLDGALLWGWKFAATIVAEVRPPVTTHKARLACEELAIDAIAICDHGAFPLPQRPVPATVRQHHITAIVVYKFFRRVTPDAAVEQRQEPHLLDGVHQLRAGVYLGRLQMLIFLLLFRDEELVASLTDELAGIGIRKTWALDLGTTTEFVALETTILVSGLHHDVVILHDKEEGKLLPTGDHLVTLLTAVVRQQFDTFLSSSQSQSLASISG